jgi:hypothetical protein
MSMPRITIKEYYCIGLELYNPDLHLVDFTGETTMEISFKLPVRSGID